MYLRCGFINGNKIFVHIPVVIEVQDRVILVTTRKEVYIYKINNKSNYTLNFFSFNVEFIFIVNITYINVKSQ